MNGRAIQVTDPVFLAALQAQVAQGAVPPAFLLADLMGGRVPTATTKDPQAEAAGHGVVDPENMPETSSAAANTSVEEPTPPRSPETPGAQPEVNHVPAEERLLDQFEQLVARRADDEAMRLSALHREHEARLAQQAESAAKLQAALLREVLDAHRAEQAEQASRHAQVIRDLLREHQCQLDDRATAAITRETQAISTLLREHRNALAEAQDAHRSDLEEILEHHRGELQAARGAHGSDDKLHVFLTEQTKLQREIHAGIAARLTGLAATVEHLGEAVGQLAAKVDEPRPDLSWLPPPSFVPPLPVVPGASRVASPASPPLPESPSSAVAEAEPMVPCVPPTVPPPPLSESPPSGVAQTAPVSSQVSCPAQVPTSPSIAREAPPRSSKTASLAEAKPDPRREQDSVRELLDDVYDDDPGEDVEDDEPLLLRPLTPLTAHC